jgi:hypothetical protein
MVQIGSASFDLEAGTDIDKVKTAIEDVGYDVLEVAR